ncbi:MAG: phosphatidylglycerophosphatase A [Balneola sp.]|nr:MAG: phosphatidylglycerophosphatase A [Balneola sp.]
MKSLKLFIGTGFGSGMAPVAPGTIGSLVATIALYFVLMVDPYLGPVIFMIAAGLLTLWVGKTCEEEWGKDPGKVVIDEFSGQAVVFISIPLFNEPTLDALLMGVGFLLFRIFDIWKPLGIRKVQKTGGGLGILLDDLIAGLYALICLKTLIFFASKIV